MTWAMFHVNFLTSNFLVQSLNFYFSTSFPKKEKNNSKLVEKGLVSFGSSIFLNWSIGNPNKNKQLFNRSILVSETGMLVVH